MGSAGLTDTIVIAAKVEVGVICLLSHPFLMGLTCNKNGAGEGGFGPSTEFVNPAKLVLL